jgi:hypothetical protein
LPVVAEPPLGAAVLPVVSAPSPAAGSTLPITGSAAAEGLYSLSRRIEPATAAHASAAGDRGAGQPVAIAPQPGLADPVASFAAPPAGLGPPSAARRRTGPAVSLDAFAVTIGSSGEPMISRSRPLRPTDATGPFAGPAAGIALSSAVAARPADRAMTPDRLAAAARSAGGRMISTPAADLGSPFETVSRPADPAAISDRMTAIVHGAGQLVVFGSDRPPSAAATDRLTAAAAGLGSPFETERGCRSTPIRR